LEHLAQTIATYLGYEAHLRGKGPSIGMVVAVRNYRLFRPSIAVGEQLVLRATMTQGDTERSQFEGEVLSKGECVARGVLTLVRVGDLTAKPSSSRAGACRRLRVGCGGSRRWCALGCVRDGRARAGDGLRLTSG